MLIKKVKAGALQYTVLIALVLTLLVAFYVLFSLNLSHINSLYTTDAKWINVLHSAENIIGCKKYPISGEFELEVQGEKVKVQMTSWGGYTLSKLSSPVDSGRVKRTLLSGAIFPVDTLALYVADNKRFLSVGGHTRIYGNCYVPAKGIKRVMGRNHVASGDNAVFGKVRKSENVLPELSQDFITILNAPDTSAGIEIVYSDIEDRQLINSFHKPTVFLNMNKKKRLGKITIKGNVVVLADSIVVAKNTTIEDACIYARHITIEPEWRGNGFFFAEQSLHVGKSASLLLPSVLAVNAQADYAELTIHERASVSGAAICYSASNKTSILTLDDFAQLHGVVYSTSRSEIKGKVFGSVISQQLISRGASFKTNHIEHGIINARKVSPYLALPNLFEETSVVLKKLY